MREAEHLVHRERPENSYRHREGPQLIHPQTGHQKCFDQAVRKQVYRGESYAAIRHILRRVEHVKNHRAVWRPCQQVLAYFPHQIIHLRRPHEKNNRTAQEFQQAVVSLYGDSYFERFVKNGTIASGHFPSNDDTTVPRFQNAGILEFVLTFKVGFVVDK